MNLKENTYISFYIIAQTLHLSNLGYIIYNLYLHSCIYICTVTRIELKI